MEFLKKFFKLLQVLNKQNIETFFIYTKRHGLKHALNLTIFFLEGLDLLPAFIYKFKIIKQFSYFEWIKKNEPSLKELDMQKLEVKHFSYQPLISLIVPTYNTPQKLLIEMIESVINQTYPYWELCVADGASDKIHVKKILTQYLQKDKRIKVKFLSSNKGIVGNTNEALTLAKGDFIGFLDHDDLLAPFALYEVVKLLNQKPDLDFIYSDEDKISENGLRRFDPLFKPRWGPTPDMLRSCNYITHFAVIRRHLLDKIGWFKEGFEGSQDYELFLRVIENTDKIGHIPKILYHWRFHSESSASGPVKPYAYVAAKRALKEHMQRLGYNGEVIDLEMLGCYRIIYKLNSKPLVSIIISIKDRRLKLLEKCVNSIIKKTSYRNFEIILINNQLSKNYFEKFQKYNFLKILNISDFFNLSISNNYAANHAKGSVLLFLHSNCEVINSTWLKAMLEHIQRKEIGAVGAKLYFPNGRVQHGGIIIGIKNLVYEAHKYFHRKHPGYMGRLKIVHNVSAVTGACLMTRKEVFQEVGGFDENLQVAYNDVDLCLKIREKGYLIVWTPFAELYHHEKLTRGRPSNKEKWELEIKEREYFKTKWRHLIEKGDPYYNPNLNQECADFSLKL